MLFRKRTNHILSKNAGSTFGRDINNLTNRIEVDKRTIMGKEENRYEINKKRAGRKRFSGNARFFFLPVFSHMVGQLSAGWMLVRGGATAALVSRQAHALLSVGFFEASTRFGVFACFGQIHLKFYRSKIKIFGG